MIKDTNSISDQERLSTQFEHFVSDVEKMLKKEESHYEYLMAHLHIEGVPLMVEKSKLMIAHYKIRAAEYKEYAKKLKKQ